MKLKNAKKLYSKSNTKKQHHANSNARKNIQNLEKRPAVTEK